LTGGEFSAKKNMRIIDLFELYQRQFCETKKLLAIA
jgi:hypothetical protein